MKSRTDLIGILFEISQLRLPVELEISMIKEYLSVVLLPYNGFYNLLFYSQCISCFIEK